MVSLLPTESPLLTWLPAETLFSLCSRHHGLWGYKASSRSTQAMFGGHRAGSQHDLPSSLNEFEARTGSCFGSAAEIARERTLLQFYRPFLSGSDVVRAVETMRGPSVANLKFSLGILTSRFRAHHPLKACSRCMQRDVENEGWAYWHLQHQFPGVWVCPLHHDLLLTSTVKSTGVERFLWHLPVQDRLIADSVGPSPGSVAALARFAGLVTGLVELDAPDGWLCAPAVQATLRSRLNEMGWVTAAGNTRLRAAAGHYLLHCQALRVVTELFSLPADLEIAKDQLGRLIRPLRAGTHPLRLLLAIDWLFKDAQDFINSHTRVQPLAGDTVGSSAEIDAGIDRHGDPRRDQLLDLMRRNGSATAAARTVGVDVGTAMAWAAAAGVTVGRRPKLLTELVRQPLVRDLSEGGDKNIVAERHGVSVATVNRLLQTEVGLHASWAAARATTARQKARETWLTLLAQHHSLGVKLMRASNPAAYAWLYRNDRSWLREHTPSGRAEFSGVRASTVRWDQRDECLSQEVRNAAMRLSHAQPGKLLRLWQIYQAVPELKPKLRVLERLPLTRRALESAIGRPHPSGHLFD
jgi:hypothetical protein